MRGVQVLEAAVNADANMADYIARFRPNHPAGKVSLEFMMNFCQLSPMIRPTVPILVFVDRKGMVQSQYLGSDPFIPPETNAAAAQLLKERIRGELERIMKTGQEPPPARKTGKSKRK